MVKAAQIEGFPQYWVTDCQLDAEEAMSERDRLRAEVGRLKARLEAFANANSSLAAHDTETSIQNARLRARNANLLMEFGRIAELSDSSRSCLAAQGCIAREIARAALASAQQHGPEYQPIDAEGHQVKP